MAAAQEGDGKAYEALLHEVLPPLRGFAAMRLSGDVGTADVVQNVLLSVHRSRHTYRPEQPFEPWLWAIARNAIIDFQRRRVRRAGREEALPEDDALPEELWSSVDADGHGGQSFPPELDHALSLLTPGQRQAVLLHHRDGLSVIEAALRIRVSPGALKARLHRAYHALRSLVQETS
jgi:RNA polymerase sigma-70 factor, ECF subfamily